MASSTDLTESEDDLVDVMKIKEFDPEEMKKTMSFLNIDFQQHAAEQNKKNAAIRQQLGKSYSFEMRSEAARLKSFLSYKKLSSWCPKLMASAGFYFTGVEHSVQCFCCGLVFCSTSLRTPPYEDHVRHNTSCEFIQGKDVGNIPKYEVRVQLLEINHGDLMEFITEESRVISFGNWPFYVRIQAEELARAGFFFTGLKDTVQCFACGGCLGNWKENDDPWKEHAKFFPECSFLASKKSQSEIKQYIASYNGFSGFTGKHFTTVLGDKILPTETRSKSNSIFQDEDIRLDSFKRWPENSHINPADLARAGFYYTGISDAVKCFTCGISFYSFEAGDDPYIEHIKYGCSCEFLCNMAHIKPIQGETERQFCASERNNTCLTNINYEHLILHLDRLHGLKELTLNCAKDEWDVINILPDGFKNLKNIKRIQLKNIDLSRHSLRLVDFIGHFENLSSFTLSCNCFPEFEKLMKAISENKKIQQIHLSGMFISKKEFEDLSAVLHSLAHLTVLDIEGNRCADAKALSVLVQALPSLTQLEELKLPSGPEVKDAAASIIKQFRHLPKLRKIFISDILDDSSLIALAEEARGGNLSSLEKLDLSLNHDITQSGWKDFFLMVDGLGRLNELCITRLYTQQFKTDPLTLIALVQCVSRLHHLNKLVMHGWLLDEKDLEMFNAMKKKHPQSYSFMLLWQWILPFQPNVTE